MKKRVSLLKSAVCVAAGALLLALPFSTASAAEGYGSDYAFNEMVLDMAGRDTGSMWFDYYVASVKQQLAAQSAEEPYGAAGPSAQTGTFDGYLGGFIKTDTGSLLFADYLDSLQRVLKAKGY